MTGVGPRRPVEVLPAQAPSSLRRLVHLDVSWPGDQAGDPGAPSVVAAAGRDLVRTGSARPEVAADARLDVRLAPGAIVDALSCEPALEGTHFLGRSAGRGWRAVLRDLHPLPVLLAQLFDDLPVALLVSGYAGLRNPAVSLLGVDRAGVGAAMRDVCSGWRSGGQALLTLQSGAVVPAPDLVPVPVASRDGWAPLMAASSVRRSRRLDVARSPSGLLVEAAFRDTWCDPVDGEGILHEYVVQVLASPQGRIEQVTADPRVLPYPECPGAVAAVQRLVGRELAELGRDVPELLAGPGSCTHLNDLLRSIAAVTSMAGDENSHKW